MIPPRFEYHSPKTVGEAVALLGQLGSDAKLLAGGHSLLPSEAFAKKAIWWSSAR
jgi:carbon-monoxide dehydrogenase medium subunit